MFRGKFSEKSHTLQYTVECLVDWGVPEGMTGFCSTGTWESCQQCAMRVSVGELPDFYPVLASWSSQRGTCLHVHHAEVPLWMCAALGSRIRSPFECNQATWGKLVFFDMLLLLPFPFLLSEAPWLSSSVLASSLKGGRSISWGSAGCTGEGSIRQWIKENLPCSSYHRC